MKCTYWVIRLQYNYYTDHQALVSGYISYLKGQSKGLPFRWYLKISQYLPHLMIEYKPGKSNEAADALSRAPAYTKEASEHSDEDGMVLQITVSAYPEEALLQNIQTQQSEDREILDIKTHGSKLRGQGGSTLRRPLDECT